MSRAVCSSQINKENKDLKDQLNVVEKAFAELLARSEKTKIAINNFKVQQILFSHHIHLCQDVVECCTNCS